MKIALKGNPLINTSPLLTTITLLLIINNPSTAESSSSLPSLSLIFPKVRVVVQNDMKDETATAHCYSSEDDIGTHVLSYGEHFGWHFKMNVGGSTKFYCDFTTRFGSGNYAVFDIRLKYQVCGNYCLWKIKEDGPCVGSYCQNWKSG